VALREQLNYLLNQREKHFVSAFDIGRAVREAGRQAAQSRVVQTAYQQRDVSLLSLRHAQE